MFGHSLFGFCARMVTMGVITVLGKKIRIRRNKKMNLLFIQSILSGDFPTLKVKMLVVCIAWIAVLAAIVIDLFSGVKKAKLRGEYTSSEGLKRTVSKFVLYYSALGIALLADWLFCYMITSFNSFIPAIPYLTIICALYLIIAVEGRSVLENADKKQKKQLSTDLQKLIELAIKVKDKEVLEYLKKIAEKDDTQTGS